ncbi:MAG: phage tail protein [Chloroflexota bacterium]
MIFDLRELSLNVSGKFADTHVYQKNGMRRAYFIPTNPQTEAQQLWRNRFGDLARELSDVGGDLRAALRAGIGYSWNAPVIGYLLKHNGLMWSALAAEYAGFDLADRESWQEYDTTPVLVNPRGEVFFLAASALWQVCKDRGGGEPFERPAAGNVGAIAAVWPRSEEVDLTGFCKVFAGGVAPEGWLLCNGASMDRKDYPALFEVLGTRYGAEDDDHFTLPELIAHEGVAAGSVTYDDRAVDWIFGGTWVEYGGSGPYLDTLTYNQTPGDYAMITFYGNRFELVYTGHVNRNKVRILLDGDELATIDAYRSSLQWQQVYDSGEIGLGMHGVIFEHVNNGRTVVDVDALRVYHPDLHIYYAIKT